MISNRIITAQKHNDGETVLETTDQNIFIRGGEH